MLGGGVFCVGVVLFCFSWTAYNSNNITSLVGIILAKNMHLQVSMLEDLGD